MNFETGLTSSCRLATAGTLHLVFSSDWPKCGGGCPLYTVSAQRASPLSPRESSLSELPWTGGGGTGGRTPRSSLDEVPVAMDRGGAGREHPGAREQGAGLPPQRDLSDSRVHGLGVSRKGVLNKGADVRIRVGLGGRRGMRR